MSDIEIYVEQKQLKMQLNVFRVMLGIAIGVAVYKTAKDNLGILTFLPVIYIPILVAIKAKLVVIDNEINARSKK